MRVPALILMTTLTACGGASTGPNGGGGPIAAPSYNVLAAQSGGTSQISGAALTTDSSSGNVSASSISGQLRHWNGYLSVSDGVATFTANGDGLQLGGVTQADDGSTIITSSGGLGDGYEFLTVFQSHSPATINGTDAVGVFGIATDPAHMPSSGSATFSGEVEAMLVTQTEGTYMLTDGSALLSVNFGSGNGNLLLNQFTPLSPTGAAIGGSPVNTIRIWDMSIDGSTMTGGTLVINPGMGGTTPLGDDINLTTLTQFFGFDPDTFTPAEVGGVIHATGEDGILTGVYVAQQ